MQVRYFVRGEANNNASVKSVVTSDTAMPFTGLMQRTEYGFQVRAKTTHGWGEFSPPVFKTTGQVLGTGTCLTKLDLSDFYCGRQFFSLCWPRGQRADAHSGRRHRGHRGCCRARDRSGGSVLQEVIKTVSNFGQLQSTNSRVSAAAPTTATRSSPAIVILWNTETAKVGIWLNAHYTICELCHFYE